MKDDDKLDIGFIPYMSKAFGFLNTESFLNKNIYKLESLSLEEARELLLKEIEISKSMPIMAQRQHLQKVFNKLFSIQPGFEKTMEKEVKNTEQRLFADLIFSPGFLDNKEIREYLENYYVMTNKTNTKAKTLIKLLKKFDSLSPESIEKVKYCFKSSSIFAKSLLYNENIFDILNDRNLSLFNKETFSQLFRFSQDYTMENFFSEYFNKGNDKALFMISQMSNQLYEQLGHTSEFLYSTASLARCSSLPKIMCEYYDKYIGSKENEAAFIENIKKNGMPYEMRELLNTALDFAYYYTSENLYMITKDLDSFMAAAKQRRENNHINIFGADGFEKFKERKFSLSDFKKINTMDDLNKFKDSFLINIYGITLKQAEEMLNRYASDIDALEKGIIESDRDSFEILKSILSIKEIKLENQDGIKLLQEAYFKYMEEKGLNYQKENNSSAILEGIFNRMYMNTYNSILVRDVSKKSVIEIDDGVPVYDAGVNFNMIVTALNGTSNYFQNGVNIASKWNTAFRDVGQGMCASFISNQNLGVIALDGPLLGFANIPNDALNTMGVTDIYSWTNYFNLKNVNNRTSPFIVGSKMSDETRYGYNEIVVDRFLSTDEDEKIKLQPDYVVFYKTNEKYKSSATYAQTLKTAKEFGIPIVVVDYYKVKEYERVCIKAMENELFRNEVVDKDLLVGILTRYMNNISGDRTIHGHPRAGGGGVPRTKGFPEDDLGVFIDRVISRCEETKDEMIRSEWIDAIDCAYQQEYRKHMKAIAVKAYNCSLGTENDKFNLITDYNLSQRIRTLHRRFDKKEKQEEVDINFREGVVPPEVETIVKLSTVLAFNNTYEIEKAMNQDDKHGFVVKNNMEGEVSLEEKLIFAYFTDNYYDDVLNDFKNKKENIRFGTVDELRHNSLNKASFEDKIKGTYLEKEIAEKGIDMRKMSMLVGLMNNLDTNQFFNVFKAHIYNVSDNQGYSCLYITDKFNEKKENLKKEMDKLCGITDTYTESTGKKK